MKQHQALQLLKMGKNIFLTGAAGAGKTYLVNQYIQYLKTYHVNIAVTASTGIAATHLQGMTLHAWSGIGIKNSLTQKDLEKLLTNDRIKRNYKKTKVLIIDEISMLHKHQLEMVDTIARAILQSDKPFGSIQIVLCGDFFQLPPVSTDPTKTVDFAFESTIWDEADFHVCYLEEQHRQQNDPLLTILNDIRSGTAGEHTKVPLRTRYKKEPEGNIAATKLYSRNINVDAINHEALNQLSGKEKIFQMKTNGFSALTDSLKRNCLALETLKLKIGAQVMFIKNDMAGRYVNGTRCVVVGFDKKDGFPVVKTMTGELIVAEPDDWQYEENGTVRATITQVPLRLAWAITIHKSQGMTLDAAEMDLGDAFEPGMGYVALSRVRKLSGLKLMNLNEMALTVHPKVLQQDHIFKKASHQAIQYLATLSPNDMIHHENETLVKRFCGDKNKKMAASNKQKIPTHFITLQLLKEKHDLKSIAEKRGFTTDTVLNHIEKLKGQKQIDHDLIAHLKNTIPQSDFDIIFSALQQSKDGALTPIYDKLKRKYAYEMLKVVRLFVSSSR